MKVREGVGQWTFMHVTRLFFQVVEKKKLQGVIFHIREVTAGLHVRRKHEHKHKYKPRVNRDDASTSARKRNARLCHPGSQVACACA